MRFNPATSERTTTIFPAMYCKGMQSIALSPFCGCFTNVFVKLVNCMILYWRGKCQFNRWRRKFDGK